MGASFRSDSATARCHRMRALALLVLALLVVTMSAAPDRAPARLSSELYLGERILQWEIGNSVFRALPERGARLMSWRIQETHGNIRNVLHWPELQSLDAFHDVHGGNPILFPFSGPSEHAGQRRRWRDPEGNIRPMPMHGIARQGQFAVTAADAWGFTALFQPDAEAQSCYPYNYRFMVTYTFGRRKLECELRLHNLDRRPLPWAAGFHPYFAIPWRSGTQRSDYEITLPHPRVAEFDPAGQFVDLPAIAFPQPLTNPLLRDRYFIRLAKNELSFGRTGTTERIQMWMDAPSQPDPDVAVVLWTKSADSPFFCIEPWMGPRNAAETKIGLRWVAPGEEQSFRIEIAVPEEP